jgi:putative endonuclease
MSRKLACKSKYWVYIVQCGDGTYYTGYTNSLTRRIEQHNKRQGATYLKKGKLPVELVYAKEYRYYKNAMHAERRLKKLTREQKLRLIRIYDGSNCENS